MKIVFYVKLLLIGALFFLSGCSKEPKVDGGKVFTVEAQSFSNTLYYPGVIQPLKTVVVPSQVDGTVVDMPFQYGEAVKTGQLLFVISSAKFLSEYKTALMQYIKAKSDFNTSEAQLAEAKFLHKNELISDDNFKLKRSSFYSAQLALLQARDTLENLLHQLNLKDINPYELTIADVDKITEIIRAQTNTKNQLRLVSPTDGIILSASKGEEDNKKVGKGDVVKLGDALAVIGDMSGLSVRIKVNELTINQLKQGQKVKITGIAFPDEELEGVIEKVEKQGEIANGGMPIFSVEVIVPKLTAKQQKNIHVGMSAKVEINVSDEPQIMVPVPAIIEKNGLAFVKLYHIKSKKIEEVQVKTGKTTVDSVAVLAGLKAGDKIVIPH